HTREIQVSNRCVSLKFHEHVHIAVGAEAPRQNRAEKGQFPNMVPLTKPLNFRLGNFDAVEDRIHRLYCGTRRQAGCCKQSSSNDNGGNQHLIGVLRTGGELSLSFDTLTLCVAISITCLTWTVSLITQRWLGYAT